jgi:hypothetical protein
MSYVSKHIKISTRPGDAPPSSCNRDVDSLYIIIEIDRWSHDDINGMLIFLLSDNTVLEKHIIIIIILSSYHPSEGFFHQKELG